MADVAKYIKIFNASPNDDYVTKRSTAINSIETLIKKKNTFKELYELANALISALDTPKETNSLINGVAVVPLQKSSTSFVADEEQLQILVCTLLAIQQFLEKTKAYNNIATNDFVLALALWNGLSFQNPIKDKERLEALRQEILQICSNLMEKVVATSRTRKETKLRVAPSTPADNTFPTFIANAEASYGVNIDAMRINSFLDREEIDVLWWVLSGWSSVSTRQLAGLTSVQSAILSSIEIGNLLRRFPSQAHTHLACRGGEHITEFSGEQILKELGQDITLTIAQNIGTSVMISDYPRVFPVSNLLVKANSVAGIKKKRQLMEWSARILCEMSMLNIINFNE